MNRNFACVRVLPSDRHFHTPPNAACSAHQRTFLVFVPPPCASTSPETKEPRDLPGPTSPPARLDTKKLLVHRHRLLLFPPPPAVGAAGRTAPGRRDVGVLPDIAAPDAGHGRRHAPLLRRSRRAALRRRHRRIRMVLLPLHHHPRPRRHLDGQIPHGISPPPPHPLPPVPFIAQLRLRWFGC